jgi:methionine-rich copper-binding protein CopC
MRLLVVATLIGLSLVVTVTEAGAHAFPERSEPRVGAVVRTAPTQVRIWFDGNLESAFSQLTVADTAGRRIDRGDGHVDPDNRRLLQVGLPPLDPGVYKVRWSVLAVDGHRTQGDYTFTLKAGE